MESNNVEIGSLQRILGHENRSTTEIYLHSIGDSEKVAISIYEQARQKSHTAESRLNLFSSRSCPECSGGARFVNMVFSSPISFRRYERDDVDFLAFMCFPGQENNHFQENIL
jgi:hypothetical protein